MHARMDMKRYKAYLALGLFLVAADEESLALDLLTVHLVHGLRNRGE